MLPACEWNSRVFRFSSQTPQIVSECHSKGSPSFTSYENALPVPLCAFPEGPGVVGQGPSFTF